MARGRNETLGFRSAPVRYQVRRFPRSCDEGAPPQTYDERGNLVEESLGTARAEYAYDATNRMTDAYTKVEGFTGHGHPGGPGLKAGVRYEYDALGRRVSRAEYRVTERGRGHERSWDTEAAEAYLYDGLRMEILAEYKDTVPRPGDLPAPYLPWLDEGGRPGWGERGRGDRGHRGWGRGGREDGYRLTAEYVFANGESLSRADYDPADRWGRGRKGTEYYTQDILGSVMAVTDRTGRVTDRPEYDAFGSAYGGSRKKPNTLGYNGKRFDPATGLYVSVNYTALTL